MTAEDCGKTILIVDDDDAKRYGLTKAVASGGFKAVEATTGLAALEMLEDVAAVVLDVHLPDLHGFEVCSRMRRSRPNLPVVLVSSVFVDPPYPTAGKMAGADAYLLSPVEPAELQSLLADLTRNSARP